MDIKDKKLQAFIDKADALFSGKYEYTIDASLKFNQDRVIVITCPIHGKFRMSVGYHLKGNGCPMCG